MEIFIEVENIVVVRSDSGGEADDEHGRFGTRQSRSFTLDDMGLSVDDLDDIEMTVHVHTSAQCDTGDGTVEAGARFVMRDPYSQWGVERLPPQWRWNCVPGL